MARVHPFCYSMPEGVVAPNDPGVVLGGPCVINKDWSKASAANRSMGCLHAENSIDVIYKIMRIEAKRGRERWFPADGNNLCLYVSVFRLSFPSFPPPSTLTFFSFFVRCISVITPTFFSSLILIQVPRLFHSYLLFHALHLIRVYAREYACSCLCTKTINIAPLMHPLWRVSLVRTGQMYM